MFKGKAPYIKLICPEFSAHGILLPAFTLIFESQKMSSPKNVKGAVKIITLFNITVVETEYIFFKK